MFQGELSATTTPSFRSVSAKLSDQVHRLTRHFRTVGPKPGIPVTSYLAVCASEQRGPFGVGPVVPDVPGAALRRAEPQTGAGLQQDAPAAGAGGAAALPLLL